MIYMLEMHGDNHLFWIMFQTIIFIYLLSSLAGTGIIAENNYSKSGTRPARHWEDLLVSPALFWANRSLSVSGPFSWYFFEQIVFDFFAKSINYYLPNKSFHFNKYEEKNMLPKSLKVIITIHSFNHHQYAVYS